MSLTWLVGSYKIRAYQRSLHQEGIKCEQSNGRLQRQYRICNNLIKRNVYQKYAYTSGCFWLHVKGILHPKTKNSAIIYSPCEEDILRNVSGVLSIQLKSVVQKRKKKMFSSKYCLLCSLEEIKSNKLFMNDLFFFKGIIYITLK